MKRIRVIPSLLLTNGGLVKTMRFGKRTYIGDPFNSVKIFNDKEVDELLLLDIDATPSGKGPDIEQLRAIASECFIPLAYGGGIGNMEQARRIFDAGVEKVVINTALYENPILLEEIANTFGSQAVVASLDAKRGGISRRYSVYSKGAKNRLRISPRDAALRAVEAGAGEILVTAIDRDGTMKGYDIELISMVAKAVDIPVIASGGAASLDDFCSAVLAGHASAVSAGAMFVFKGPHRAVLINYPNQAELRSKLFTRLIDAP